MAKDANFQRTFVIKIHGITGEGDIPRFVHRDLWNTMQDLSQVFKSMHYSISEESDEPEPWGGSDMWPEFNPIKAKNCRGKWYNSNKCLPRANSYKRVMF